VAAFLAGPPVRAFGQQTMTAPGHARSRTANPTADIRR
jgi:hypothetical protein